MSEETPSPWPKWQVGAAVGAGIAVAATAGYLYYKSRGGDVDTSFSQSPSTASENNTSSSISSAGPTSDVKEERGAAPASVSGSKDGSSAAVQAKPEPEDYQKRKAQGNSLYREGNYLPAIEAYREGLALCPELENIQKSIFYQNIAATYERIAEGADTEAGRTEAWTNVRQSCSEALKLNERYTKAYTRRARSNYMLKDFSAALEDITAANLLETSSNPTDPRPSDQVMQLATRVLKELGEEKASALYESRAPIKVSRNFIRTYLDSFYFDLGKFYDVTDDVIAECLAVAERELDAIGLGADGDDFAGAETQKLPVSRTSVGYRCTGADAAAQLYGTAATAAAAAPVENGLDAADTVTEAAATPSEDQVATNNDDDDDDVAHKEDALDTTGDSGLGESAAGDSNAPAAGEATVTVEDAADNDADAEQEPATTEQEPATTEQEPATTEQEPAVAVEEGEVVDDTVADAPTEENAAVVQEPEDALRSEGHRLYMRAILKYKNGQFTLADQACRRAQLFASDDEGYFTKTQIAQMHLLEASVDQMYSRFDSAGVGLAAVIALKDHIPPELLSHALIKRGSQYLVLGKADEALLDFQHASVVTPKNADVFHHRGQMHALMNHMTEAMTDYQEAVKLAPDWPAASVQQAYATYKMATMTGDSRQLAQTMQQFEDIRQKFPNYAEGLYMYGQVVADAGNLPETERLYEAARRADPENVSVRVHEALLVLQKDQDFDRTMRMLHDALTVDPHSDFVYETMAQLEVQRHNIDKAVEFWDKALRLVRTRLEMIHLFSIREATVAQSKMCKKLGIDLTDIAPEMW